MKILVTGGSGMVGQAIKNVMNELNETHDFVFLSSKDANLTNFLQTRKLFRTQRPDMVIHLAACVGGLFKNMNQKVDMYEKNMLINHNVLKCSHDFKVKKVVSCLSTCIFPNKTKYPIKETMLHNGPPHTSNEGYAYAKRMLEVHSRMYNEQYGDNFICVIPTNIYGEHDNYNLEDAHVIPSLIHKCYLAKQKNEPFIVFGSGKPLRQFIYSQDLARLILWSLLKYDKKDTLILSVSEKKEVSIKKVATIIAEKMNYKNNMKFDTTKSDGQYKKTASNKLLLKQNPNFKFVDIDKGLDNTIKWFIDNYDSCRK